MSEDTQKPMIFALAQSFYARLPDGSIDINTCISTRECISEEEAIGQFVKHWAEHAPGRESIGVPVCINVTETHNIIKKELSDER